MASPFHDRVSRWPCGGTSGICATAGSGDYVLEGEVTFRLGADTILAGPGDFVHVPRGNVHCFRNDGETVARLILTFTPSGIEKFFEETLQRALDPDTDPPESVEAVAARYAEAAPRYGMEFLVG